MSLRQLRKTETCYYIKPSRCIMPEPWEQARPKIKSGPRGWAHRRAPGVLFPELSRTGLTSKHLPGVNRGPRPQRYCPAAAFGVLSISLSKSFSSSYCRTLYIIYACASPPQRGFRTVRNSKFERCLRKSIKVPAASPPLSPLARSYMHSGGGHAELTWGRRAFHSEQKKPGAKILGSPTSSRKDIDQPNRQPQV
ncbi:hypothetical protein B0J18DRAFT_264837 [Chaetomium sp. MPI-SDFR-AT-0129]|nr:hypothetical protein B0J18DRAFT_264837 [Chaetomium sp. MPI-SDFR-AT-0129]